MPYQPPSWEGRLIFRVAESMWDASNDYVNNHLHEQLLTLLTQIPALYRRWITYPLDYFMSQWAGAYVVLSIEQAQMPTSEYSVRMRSDMDIMTSNTIVQLKIFRNGYPNVAFDSAPQADTYVRVINNAF